MKYVVFFGFLTMIGCNKKPENLQVKITVDTISQNPIKEKEPKDTTTVPFSKTLTGNGYSYVLKGRQETNEVINFKSINIFFKKKLHQKIIFDTVSVLREAEAYFDVSKDVNFDGYNDLEVINQVGNYWSSSSFWLYDKKLKKYEYYKPMDTIINPVVDSKSKSITSNYHIGPTDFYYKVYEWKNNKLVMTNFRADENRP
jgi:hypothetical protein